MPGRRFALLDRDGTVIVERQYLSGPDGVELLQGAAEGLRRLRDCGLGLAILTNQSGVGRRYFDEECVTLVHTKLRDLLAEQGISLDGIYICPHTPQDACQCRKPRPGLAHQAAKELQFDPQAAFVIGDKPCDIGLGRAVGATTFLVRTGYGSTFAADPAVGADYVVSDLADASTRIERLLAVKSDGVLTQKENSAP